MKKLLFLFLLSSICFSEPAQQVQAQVNQEGMVPTKRVILHVKGPLFQTDISTQSSSNNSGGVRVDAALSNSSTQGVNVESRINSYISSIVKGGNELAKNKRYLLAGVLAIVYTYFFRELRSMENYLHTGWSNWKLYEDIYSIPKKELIEELSLEIHKQYFNFYSLHTDMMSRFLDDIREERIILEKYERLIKKIFFRRLFFLDNNILKSLTVRKQHLDYFEKNLFEKFYQRNVNMIIDMLSKGIE